MNFENSLRLLLLAYIGTVLIAALIGIAISAECEHGTEQSGLDTRITTELRIGSNLNVFHGTTHFDGVVIFESPVIFDSTAIFRDGVTFGGETSFARQPVIAYD